MSTKKEKCCDVCKPNGVGYCNNLLCRPCHLQSESIEWEQYCISNDEAYNDIDPKIRGMLSRSDLKHFVNGWNTFVKTKLSKAITTAVAKRELEIAVEGGNMAGWTYDGTKAGNRDCPLIHREAVIQIIKH